MIKRMVMFAAAVGLSAGVSLACDPFAGKVFKVTATPDAAARADGVKIFNEAVLFHEGTFSAEVLAMFGFAPVSYTVTEENERASFSVVLSSTDRGTIEWTGREGGQGFTGTLIWSRLDGKVHRYDVTGELQPTYTYE